MSPYLGRMIPRALNSRPITPRLSTHLRCLSQLHQPTRCFFPRPQSSPDHRSGRLVHKPQQRYLSSTTPLNAASSQVTESELPICCPGCGAYAQTVEPEEAGFYRVKKTSKPQPETQEETGKKKEDPEGYKLKAEGDSAVEEIRKLTLESEDAHKKPKNSLRVHQAVASGTKYLEKSKSPVPICDRCRDLVHHNKAVPTVSPSIDTIQAFLEESPHKSNRIYHVIDAADFPMSLVENIHEALNIQGQRSRNRRSSNEKFKGGRKLPTISFVITRSDLLAPTKEQVDSKMNYVRARLREALDLETDDYRLGNVHMISAHRGWWTKKLKEEIADHGGGIWVVGKANVGKSSFIEACFPKDSKNLEKIAELIERRQAEGMASPQRNPPALDSDSLLPPAPREDLYPVLPVVSSLPGTTVSPIRIPFGRGKGEMIDLPGLDRSELSEHVLDKYKRSLIMAKRGKPERCVMKPGQSLLLGGGLVRITPVDAKDTVIATCFLPIEAHVTNTDKAIAMQAQQRIYPGENILEEGTGDKVSCAGVFDLKWDVTKSHLSTSMERAMQMKKIRTPTLPYEVMSADILVEGCGWVELTVQRRSRSRSTDADDAEESPRSSPQVEVFSPNGQHIGSRFPIECWNFMAEKPKKKRNRSSY